MAQINIVIVIYNKSLEESQTIRTLNAPVDAVIYIADNSTVDIGNREFAETHGYYYIDMGGNKGLSCAYNSVIDMMEKGDGMVCFFDDDTTVDSRYFNALRAAVDTHPKINVFVPVVRDRRGILSPCAIRGVFCRRISSLNELPEHGVSVINSGLAVRLKVFLEYRYDEGQFLDYVDHAFIRDITGNDLSRIYIIRDVILEQEFSGSIKQSRLAAMKRYGILCSDIRCFCKKYGISTISRQGFLLKRRLNIWLFNRSGEKNKG